MSENRPSRPTPTYPNIADNFKPIPRFPQNEIDPKESQIQIVELYYSLTERIERLESEIYYKSPVIIGLVIGLGILFLQLPLVLGVETSLDWFLLVVGIGFILSGVREFFR